LDNETIQQIAAEVVHRLPYGDRPWLFLLVNAVVMAVVGILATLGTSYFRTRAQNLATKHDFDELKKQLEANTDLVENIRSEVSQRDWAQREWTNLRRVKLEVLLEKMHECEMYINRSQHYALEGRVAPPERDCISELSAIAVLYFPELKNEADRFNLACRTLTVLTNELASLVLAARSRSDATAYGDAYENFKVKKAPHYQEFLVSRNQLTEVARSLLEHIMNVEKETSPGKT
jgi:hypothetical protein